MPSSGEYRFDPKNLFITPLIILTSFSIKMQTFGLKKVQQKPDELDFTGSNMRGLLKNAESN